MRRNSRMAALNEHSNIHTSRRCKGAVTTLAISKEGVCWEMLLASKTKDLSMQLNQSYERIQ